MANKVTIDVEARFVDNVTSGMNKAAHGADKFGKAVDKAQSKADKLGKTKATAQLDVNDKATSKLEKVSGAAGRFASKVFRGAIELNDRASNTLSRVTGAARSFAGKTFKAAVQIVDYATAPLKKIKDTLFSIKTLATTIIAGFALKKVTEKVIKEPISLADQYSGAKIGFSTLLGETEGQNMMNEIDKFAKATPFKTSNTIASVQKMMAYGWDVTRVIDDMKTIGDAAAATGKGDQGLESIVYALSEIRSKGKLSTQELNQLASAGIKAKAYLAEGLGYGTSDEGMAKLSKALEGGKIGANQAIEMILEGMKEFNGMMDMTANETVEGLKSQLEDTFEINIARRWGQGLQDGAKRGLGSIVKLLDSATPALERFGDLVYDIGKELSNWAADKLENTVKRIQDVVSTDTFKNASVWGKTKLLWDEVIGKPFSEWWNTKGRAMLEEKAAKIGKGIGSGLSNGILALLGIDIPDVGDGGFSIGAAFSKGFSEGFDGSAVTKAIVTAIKNVWSELPTWAKFMIGSYGTSKAISGIGAVASGVSNIVSLGGALIGSTGNAMVKGSGLLGKFASTGYGLTGGLEAGWAAGLTGGKAALLGGGSILGGAVGAVTAVKGLADLYGMYKANKAGDTVTAGMKYRSGVGALTGVSAGAMTGAAIGSVFGGIGAVPGLLIGAGIGGITGWIGGSKWAKSFKKDAEAAKFETEAMKKAVKESEEDAEQLALAFEKAVNSNIADHFGEIKLTMDEISSIASSVVLGDQAEAVNTFTRATESAKSSLQSMKSAADELDRMQWVVSMNGKLDEEGIANYKTAVDNYIYTAKQYVEDKHYEFTAAITLLMDVTQGDGKTILDNGNTFYEGLQKKISTLSDKLSSKVEIALKDGVITLDEQAEIISLQNQITKITNKLSQAKTEAEFETIKIKFGKSQISEESFSELQAALKSQLEESSATYENALTVGLTNLKLQYKDGLITEDEYNRLKEKLTAEFESKMEQLELEVQSVQIELIGESYSDVLGDDAVEKLNKGIQESIKEGISPAEWTTDDVRRFLNMDSLGEETAGALAKLLSGIEFEVEADGNVKINATYEDPTPWKPKTQNTTQNSKILIYPDYTDPTPWKPKILNTTQNANVSISPKYSLLSLWNPSSSLFNKTIYPTITVNPSYVTSSGAPYKHANGGFVNNKVISWLGEEGPEAVIPLVPGRRARGLALWAEAGKRLGVQEHAEGGIVGDRGSVPTLTMGGGDTTVEINMGGVTIEIKSDGNPDAVKNIEEHEQEIAEKVATIFKNVIGAQFSNTPLKA